MHKQFNNKIAQTEEKSKGKFRKFLILDDDRYLWTNPVHLPEEVREELFKKSKKKTSGGVYALLEVNQHGKPIDAKLVRTSPTLYKIDKEVKAKGHRLLLHAYELQIPNGFWQEWKKARTPQQRLDLIRQYELLKDNSIHMIDKIVLDVDTPFEISAPKVLEIFKMLGVNAGYEIGRTKSGNLRAFIYLHKQINAQKRYKGQRHIERIREAYYLLLELFRQYGLELDHTFADRINHPIWFSYDNRFYKQEVAIEGNVKFFDFYNAIKKWQKENQVWTVNNVNLTERFWRHKITNQEKKKNVIQLPAFIRNDLLSLADDYKLEVWKKAVLKLFDNNKDKGRFIYFIMPSIGWAKSLGLNECDVNAYLNDLLGDRDSTKTQKDLKTAWRTAHELTFNLPQHHIANLAEITETTEKALNFIKEKGEVERQELLRNIFSNQKWLCDLVMKYLEQKGLIKSKTTKQNQNKRGRPPKVYELVKDELIKETEIADTRLIEQNIDTQEQEQIEYFSQYNNYSFKRRVASSLEEAGMSFYVFYYVFYRSLYKRTLYKRRNITVKGGSGGGVGASALFKKYSKNKAIGSGVFSFSSLHLSLYGSKKFLDLSQVLRKKDTYLLRLKAFKNRQKTLSKEIYQLFKKEYEVAGRRVCGKSFEKPKTSFFENSLTWFWGQKRDLTPQEIEEDKRKQDCNWAPWRYYNDSYHKHNL